MSYERTLSAKVPRVADGRVILATAMHEAPDVDGQPGEWPEEALQAAPGVFSEMHSRDAQHDPGWYRLQWYTDGQVSHFSEPVKIGSGGSRSGRWN